MKTVLKLVALLVLSGLLYEFTFVGPVVDSYWESYKAGRAERAYQKAAAKVAEDNAPETSFDEDGDYHPGRNPSDMYIELHNTALIDENGDVVESMDLVNYYPGKILVFHVVSPTVPKRGGDQEDHFEAVMRLEEEHPDECVVYGLNPWKARSLVEDYKERFGLDYEVLTIPTKRKMTNAEIREYNEFNDAICGGDGRLCPYSVVYVKDGYVVEIISGENGYEALEDKLYAAMSG